MIKNVLALLRYQVAQSPKTRSVNQPKKLAIASWECHFKLNSCSIAILIFNHYTNKN
jgi:hypothetical protein